MSLCLVIGNCCNASVYIILLIDSLVLGTVHHMHFKTLKVNALLEEQSGKIRPDSACIRLAGSISC